MNKNTLLKFYILALLATTALASVVPVSAELPLMPQTYSLGLKYTNGDISLDSIILEHNYISDSSNQGAYVIKLFNIYGEEIYNNTFSFPLSASFSADGCIDDNGVYDAVKCGGPSYVQYDSAVQNVVVPYSFTGEKIEIYSSDSVLQLTINVSEYAEYCGDSKCTESYWSCPSDCPPTPEDEAAMKVYADEYTQQNDNGTSQNTGKDNSETENKNSSGKYYILGAITLILIFGLLIYTSKHRTQSNGPTGG
jgi:hypothetical protein